MEVSIRAGSFSVAMEIDKLLGREERRWQRGRLGHLSGFADKPSVGTCSPFSKNHKRIRLNYKQINNNKQSHQESNARCTEQNETLRFRQISQEEMAPQRAREAKELITDLGPAFVKIVQAKVTNNDSSVRHKKMNHKMSLVVMKKRIDNDKVNCWMKWLKTYQKSLEVFASRPDALPEAYQKEWQQPSSISHFLGVQKVKKVGLSRYPIFF